MGINVRTMTREDKHSVMQILRNTSEFKPSEVVVAEEIIDCYLDDPVRSGYFIMVAELGPVITGYICFGPTPLTEGTWDIYWMAVALANRSQGIGHALIEAAEKNIRGAAGRLAIIETSSTPEYANTRRFHNKHGYETIASVPDFYTPGDDRLIMLKRLR